MRTSSSSPRALSACPAQAEERAGRGSWAGSTSKNWTGEMTMNRRDELRESLTSGAMGYRASWNSALRKAGSKRGASEQRASSPQRSPPSDGGEGDFPGITLIRSCAPAKRVTKAELFIGGSLRFCPHFASQ